VGCLDCRTRRGGGEIERDGAAPARGWCVRGYNCKWLPGPRGTRSDTGDLRRPLSGGACGKDARHCHSPCTRWRFWRGGAGPRNVLGEDWLGDISVARGQRRQGSIGRRGAGALQYHHHVWSLPCVQGMEHSGAPGSHSQRWRHGRQLDRLHACRQQGRHGLATLISVAGLPRAQVLIARLRSYTGTEAAAAALRLPLVIDR